MHCGFALPNYDTPCGKFATEVRKHPLPNSMGWLELFLCKPHAQAYDAIMYAERCRTEGIDVTRR